MNELEIFTAAVETDDLRERERIVSQACGGDERLRLRIEKLLADAAKSDSFLERPHAFPFPSGLDETIDEPRTDHIGTQIGPFKLRQKLGEGGMGVVYMAEQRQPVRRRVAVKIVKPGMDSRAIVNRFEAERQALSLMDHPHIARALDAGTTEAGRPYFVMELVKGVPITRYCDDQKLSIRQRLELLIPICHAVQHAHQKGIVHRDLKPSNILIAEYDEQAVPKVIDFGVAKAIHQPLTENTLFTQIGQIIGTLEYMSPEQAKVNELDVDTRSDIYSLGVVMYELLTGTTPHTKKRLRGAAMDERIRIIRDEDPPTPSKRIASGETLPTITASRQSNPARLGAAVRGELDWIVMKALDKERSRRYQTSSELADELERFLNDEQVLACPPTTGYRLKKFVRRNARVVAAMSAVFVALSIGLIVAGWQWKETQKAYEEVSAQNSRLKSYARNANTNLDSHGATLEQYVMRNNETTQTFANILETVDGKADLDQSTFTPLLAELSCLVVEHWDRVIAASRNDDGTSGPLTQEYQIERALAVARSGDHQQAFAFIQGLLRSDIKRDSRTTEVYSDQLAKICSLCAESAQHNQTLVNQYIDQGFEFATRMVASTVADLQRIDRERSRNIQSDDRGRIFQGVHAFLSHPDLKMLRSSENRFAELNQRLMIVRNETPDPQDRRKAASHSITGFPVSVGASDQ